MPTCRERSAGTFPSKREMTPTLTKFGRAAEWDGAPGAQDGQGLRRLPQVTQHSYPSPPKVFSPPTTFPTPS